MNLKDCYNFEDFRRLAKKNLPAPIFHYIDGGSDDESTLKRNTESFLKCDLVPNILASVGEPDLSTTVFGQKIDMPLFLAPTAMQRLYHHDGDKASARAAEKFGTFYSMSTMATSSIEEIANRELPKLITVGASAYPRKIDFERMGKIAKGCGALLLADIAHIAGLVAAGLHPSPVPHADFVTTTTHKTLRGPRGGLILCKEEHGKAIDSAVFPGNQGGPLMHVIAAKAVCFAEAAKESFVKYQQQVVNNSAAFASALSNYGFHLVSGGSDNHLMLVDLRPSHPELTGKQGQIALDGANITLNRNTVPGETRSPFQTSGLRIGTPAVTSRGMKEDEMSIIASIIHDVLKDHANESNISSAQNKALALCNEFPLPY